MANLQMTNPVAQATQVGAGSVQVGNSIVPAVPAQHEPTHSYDNDGAEDHMTPMKRVQSGQQTAPNAGLGAQGINGGTIMKENNEERKKQGCCIIQ